MAGTLGPDRSRRRLVATAVWALALTAAGCGSKPNSAQGVKFQGELVSPDKPASKAVNPCEEDWLSPDCTDDLGSPDLVEPDEPDSKPVDPCEEDWSDPDCVDDEASSD